MSERKRAKQKFNRVSRALADRGADVGQFSIEVAIQSYQQQLELFNQVKESPYYYYTQRDFPIEEEVRPRLSLSIIELLFSSVRSQAVLFWETQQALLEVGRQVATQDLDALELTRIGGFFLDKGYALTNSFLTINAAPTTPHRFYSQLSGVKQLQFKKLLETIGAEKPETFRETLRRYIPRWMSYPLPYPQEQLSAKEHEFLQPLWGGYTARDASFLIHPQEIARGGRPLHLVLSLGKTLEDSGQRDLGYFLKNWGILSILAMEGERLGSENAEIPFFSYVLSGLIVGEASRTPRTAYFDYRLAIGDLLQQTFVRLEAELERGETGAATFFLQQLNKFYPQHFPNLLARSLINHGKHSDDFDVLTILRSLAKKEPAWSKGLIEAVAELPARRILTLEELTNLDRLLAIPTEESMTPEIFLKDVQAIVAKEDTYSFTTVLPAENLPTKGVEVKTEIELEAMSETITAVVLFTDKGHTRFVPFSLSFAGEKESFHLATLDDEQPDELVLETYRNLVAMAIKKEAEKVRAKALERQSRERGKIPPPSPVAEIPRLEIAELTREERIARYQQEKEGRERKRKGRTASPTVGAQQPTFLLPDQAIHFRLEERHQREIVGLDEANVERMLKEEKLDNLTPDQVIRKLDYLLEMVEVSGKMLGKNVNMDIYAELGRGFKLRQINWTLDGGKTAVRIYLQDLGLGRFLFRAIMRKQGDEQQTRFIRQLLHKISRESA